MNAKHKSKVPAKQKRTVPPQGRAFGGPVGKHWTMTVEPEEAVVIAESIAMTQMIFKNWGPEVLRLCAAYGDQLDVSAGKVHVTDAWGTISVENKGSRPTLIEMDFAPRSRS
jgi:hypothetical protein